MAIAGYLQWRMKQPIVEIQELDDGVIWRKPVYLRGATVVSCRFLLGCQLISEQKKNR